MSIGLTQNIPGLKIRLRSQYFCDMSISLVRPHAKGISTTTSSYVNAQSLQ
jgi:hypothetical protein